MVTAKLLVAACALLQANTLGKSDAQIIKMGRDAWFNYYSEKEGSSTADNCMAETTFGEVLKRRNDRLILKSPSKKSMIATLRKDLGVYQGAIYDVGYALSGGGTMWNVVFAGELADTEEAIGHILGVKDPTIKPRKVSDVKAALAKLRSRVERDRQSIESMPSGGGFGAARTGLTRAIKALDRLVYTAAKRPRFESDAILSCCLEAIETVKTFATDEP